MAHAYRSLEPGAQIVITDEPREDLEAMSRWETVDADEAQAALDAATQDEPADVPGGPTDEETAAADALAAEEAAAASAAAEAAATAAVEAATVTAPADDALDIDDAPVKATKSRSK